jgi:hypothetical protein
MTNGLQISPIRNPKKESRMSFLLEDFIREALFVEGKSFSKKTKDMLKKKAENANMPYGALASVYRKGLAAWLTGHRQGIPQHQWATARVNSFIRGGKTRSVDKAEWKKVQDYRKKNKGKKKKK